MGAQHLVVGLFWYFVFLFSVTCHEAAHALAAKWGGDETAYEHGQVSLSPIPHIRREPFGTVLFPLLSFMMGGAMIGWASAPYDPFWASRYPRRAQLMALAGPLANLALVIIAGVLIRLGLAVGLFAVPLMPSSSSIVVALQGGPLSGMALMLSMFFFLNLLLFVFNLLPFPPLDGASIICLLLSDDLAERFALFMNNQIVAILGLLFALTMFGSLFRPVFYLALRILLA